MRSEEFIAHVVDPDPAIIDGLTTLLDTYRMRVQSYPDARSFLEAWSRGHVRGGCVLVEAKLPDLSGPALLQSLADNDGAIPVILLVSTFGPELLEIARSCDRIRILQKPFSDTELVDTLLELRRAH